MSFLKQIFTWWYRQTFGTFLYTFFVGRFVAEDEFGNKYYSDSKKKKRWVIYKNRVESSKIPPEWHSWIHFQTINKPTKKAHKPEGSLLNDSKKSMKKYETWKI